MRNAAASPSRRPLRSNARPISCYVQLNANDRNYRDAMLAYAYALKAGSPGDAEAAEVATARRAQRDARAEAQMIVTEEVLDTEGRVNARLTMAYRSLRQIQHENDTSVREGLLEEVIRLLDGIIPLLSRARVTMRIDLGVIDKPPAWYQPETGTTQGRLARCLIAAFLVQRSLHQVPVPAHTQKRTRRGEYGEAIHGLLVPVDELLGDLVKRGQDSDVFAQHLLAGILSQVAYGVVFAIADSDLSNGTLGARAATITSLLMLGVPETRAIALVGDQP
jgi:hypothetical protein